jgi:hypothetical protein
VSGSEEPGWRCSPTSERPEHPPKRSTGALSERSSRNRGSEEPLQGRTSHGEKAGWRPREGLSQRNPRRPREDLRGAALRGGSSGEELPWRDLVEGSIDGSSEEKLSRTLRGRPPGRALRGGNDPGDTLEHRPRLELRGAPAGEMLRRGGVPLPGEGSSGEGSEEPAREGSRWAPSLETSEEVPKGRHPVEGLRVSSSEEVPAREPSGGGIPAGSLRGGAL